MITNRLFITAMVAATLVSGCTTRGMVRDLLCEEGRGSTPASKAAGCVAAAAYEVARQKSEDSADKTTTDKRDDKDTVDPRIKERIP